MAIKNDLRKSIAISNRMILNDINQKGLEVSLPKKTFND